MNRYSFNSQREKLNRFSVEDHANTMPEISFVIGLSLIDEYYKFLLLEELSDVLKSFEISTSSSRRSDIEDGYLRSKISSRESLNR